MSIAEIVNIEVDQGSDDTLEFLWIDKITGLAKDLTGYTAKMQVRPEYGHADILLEFSTDNNKLVLGGTAGTITIVIDPDDTNFSPSEPPWYDAVYDIYVTDVAGDGNVYRIVKGKFSILQKITELS